MRALAFLLTFFPCIALADTLVATRTIRAQSILLPTDVTAIAGDVPGTLIHPDEAVGLEARVVLYAGRPIRAGDVGPAAIIERNQIVSLIYNRQGLTIITEARALARGGVGDVLRVMNLTSKQTLSGIVSPNGAVHVGGQTALVN